MVTTLAQYQFENLSSFQCKSNCICYKMIFLSSLVTVSVSVFFAVEGCDPNQQLLQAKGKTAMHAAAAGGYVDIMACLRLVIK